MKLLIVRVSAIGDVVHTLPAVFLLTMLYPSVEIHWVVQEKVASLIEHQPFLKQVWVLPDKYWRVENWKKTFRVLCGLRAIRWDAIFDFQGILKTSLLILFLRGKKFGFSFRHARMGISSFFNNVSTKPVYTNIIQKNFALVSSLEVRNHLSSDLAPQFLVASPSLECIKAYMHLSVTPQQRCEVEAWLSSKDLGKFIILSPNTTWESKLWPLSYWKEVCDLLSKVQGYNVVILGAHFGGQAAKLFDYANTRGLGFFVPPQWGLISTLYLIQKAHMLVAPDTGLLHIADFVGTPAIGIFGPTLAIKHGPFLTEVSRRHAIQVSCNHFYAKKHYSFREKREKSCMFSLKPQDLFKKITSIL